MVSLVPSANQLDPATFGIVALPVGIGCGRPVELFESAVEVRKPVWYVWRGGTYVPLEPSVAVH